MKNTIYMAPMEGVTDTIFRNTFKKYYGGVEKYFTPFLTPNSTHKFTTRELKQVTPDTNDVQTTVPQLMTNKAEHFLWASNELHQMGYSEINLNLGCPSPTVVTKKKGAGFIYYPEELDQFLYTIFEKITTISSDLKLSIKTRLGKENPDEFYELLEIYNKYPIYELTIHPRIQTDFYQKSIRKSYFDYAYEHSKNPLVYNGDLTTTTSILDIQQKYSKLAAIMLGRGLISNPQLAQNIQSTSPKQVLDLKLFKSFHDELLTEYQATMSGDKPVLFRMKEFGSFWEKNFSESEKAIKKIKKSKSISEYKNNILLLDL